MKKKLLNSSLIVTAMCVILYSCSSNSSSSVPSSDVPTGSSEPSSSVDETKTLDLWDEEDVYKLTYNGIDEDTMPISGWVAPVAQYGCNTNAQYKILHDSGLNTILGLYETMSSSNEVFTALENAAKNDISYIVRDPSISSRCEEEGELEDYVSQFEEYSSFGGFFVADEPSKEGFSSLRAGSLGLQGLDKNLLYYTNLLPNYANVSTQCKASSYEDYVESYCKTVSPQFISYDFYGCSGTFPNVSGDYFGQIDVIKKYANKYCIPFWSFVSATAHNSIRVPEPSDIYWQVNTDLAYGAKGIQYFCYQTPTESDGFADNGTSLVDRNGKPTEIYTYAQTINRQIARMDHVLMNSTNLAMMAYNGSPRKISTETVESFREIDSIETDDDLLVGCFDHGGKSAFYFVNNNLTESCEFTVNFNNYVEANTYDMYDDDEFKGECAKIALDPGTAVLYELTNYKE